VEIGGVRILAPLNIPATVPHHASMLFSRNLLNFLLAFWDKEAKRFGLDWDDDILKGCVVTHEGKIRHEPTLKALQA
jgi:NAD(P) transhydrogenase subunit alpha